ISDRLASGMPGARKAVIAGPAHVPSLEAPEEFDRLVLAFLDGGSGTAGRLLVVPGDPPFPPPRADAPAGPPRLAGVPREERRLVARQVDRATPPERTARKLDVRDGFAPRRRVRRVVVVDLEPQRLRPALGSPCEPAGPVGAPLDDRAAALPAKRPVDR